jgi:hypothetical protein
MDPSTGIQSNANGHHQTMHLYGLPNDILPRHSIPLIIHHASGLGAWIREIEQREGIRYKRSGSIICWWGEPAGNLFTHFEPVSIP